MLPRSVTGSSMLDAVAYLESRSKLRPKQISGTNKADPLSGRRPTWATTVRILMTSSTTLSKRYEVKPNPWRRFPPLFSR